MAYHTHIPPPFAPATGTFASGQAPACGKNNPNQSGFTLVELSIVLVIIGLIVGGILVGQALIEAASFRKQISEFEKYTAAINTYKLTYNQLPGDDPNASTYGFGTNGDGNGVIGDGFNVGGESQLAFVHLGAAHLIAGNYTVGSTCTPGINFPASFVRPNIGFIIFSAIHSGQYTNNGSFSYVDAGAVWFRVGLGNANACADASFEYGGLTPYQLLALDTKMDDGLPFTGKVRLMGQDGGGMPLDVMCDDSNPMTGSYGIRCTYNTDFYVQCANTTVGSNQYTNTNTIANCPFAVRAQ